MTLTLTQKQLYIYIYYNNLHVYCQLLYNCTVQIKPSPAVRAAVGVAARANAHDT